MPDSPSDPSFSRALSIMEKLLYSSRWMVLPAVIASLILALGTFAMATFDSFLVMGQILAYVNPSLPDVQRELMRQEIVTIIVKAIDSYLIASILLIFGMGFYELFIHRLDLVDGKDNAPRLMTLRTFDDLKDRMAKLILLVLITEFFQYALKMKFSTALELLYLATGIMLIGLALYLSSLGKKPEGEKT